MSSNLTASANAQGFPATAITICIISTGQVAERRYLGSQQLWKRRTGERIDRFFQPRTDAIAAEAREAYQHGRKILVLTERTKHLDAIWPL